MHVQTFVAVILVLVTFAGQMLLPRTPSRAVAEPESVRAMRERVESLAAAVRAGEISVTEWEAEMAAFRQQ